MILEKHVLIGLGTTAVLYPFFGIKSLWFFVSSILIDIDHYLSYIIRTNFSDFNPKTMFRYNEVLLLWRHRQDLLGIDPLHTFEFIILLAVLAYNLNSQILLVILLGIIFHILCDFFFLLWYGAPFKRAFSFLEYFIRRFRMRKRGIDVNGVHCEAIEFARNNSFSFGDREGIR